MDAFSIVLITLTAVFALFLSFMAGFGIVSSSVQSALDLYEDNPEQAVAAVRGIVGKESPEPDDETGEN